MKGTQILEVREDRETGELGLMLVGTKMIEYPMVATDGLLVAHDILEHQRGANKIGTIGDELVALGGIWYVRGRYGLIGQSSIYSCEENIAFDISNMALMYMQGSELYFVPKSESVHDWDDSFDEIIEYGKEYLQAELDDYDLEHAQRDMQPYWDATLQGMRLGYDMAEKRFEDQCAWGTFEAIREQVNNLNRDWYEYQQFKLTWDRSRAYITEHYEMEDYDEGME